MQTLDALQLQLRNAGANVEDLGSRELLVVAAEHVADAALRLRSLMFELLPPEGRELRSAVEALCEVTFADAEIHWEVIGEVRGFPAPTRLVAYRLIQEALRNVRSTPRPSTCGSSCPSRTGSWWRP